MAGCLLLFWANALAAEQIRVMQWNVKSHLGNINQNNPGAPACLHTGSDRIACWEPFPCRAGTALTASAPFLIRSVSFA